MFYDFFYVWRRYSFDGVLKREEEVFFLTLEWERVRERFRREVMIKIKIKMI